MGGFSTIAGFNSGIANGKYAGDNNCTGSGSSAAVGVDCSGFVSRCWKLFSHYSTSMMPAIMDPYSSWMDLRRGDAIHKVGHVRLCVGHNPDGTIRVIEASGVDWRVSYRDYSFTDLSGYSPYKYKNMIEYVNKIVEEPIENGFIVKNYPNPFNGKTTFKINSPNSMDMKFQIYDCLGRLVQEKTVLLIKGENVFFWNSSNMSGCELSSGIYFYRFSTLSNRNLFFNKIVLLR